MPLYSCQSYWIPDLHASMSIPSYIAVAFTGRHYAVPDSPPLPQWRTLDVHPFTFNGMDFTGALFVKQRQRRGGQVSSCV